VHDLLVPIKSKPLEAFEDCAGAILRAARLVGVLNAKEEDAAEVTGIEPIEESGPGAADVKVSCRRRSEAKAWLGDGELEAGEEARGVPRRTPLSYPGVTPPSSKPGNSTGVCYPPHLAV
jgi:hypothetical protein